MLRRVADVETDVSEEIVDSSGWKDSLSWE
jgi:hypothetical protein